MSFSVPAGATRSSPPGLVVDGVEMLVPKDSSVHVDVRADSVTLLTFTIFVGSLRVEPLDRLEDT